MENDKKDLCSDKLNIRLNPKHKWAIKKIANQNDSSMSVAAKFILTYYFNNSLPPEFWDDAPVFEKNVYGKSYLKNPTV